MFVFAAIRQCEVNSLLVVLVIAFFDVTNFLFAVMWSLRFPFFWCCVGHYMRFTTLRTRPVNSRCTSSSMPDLLTNFTSLDAGSQAVFLFRRPTRLKEGQPSYAYVEELTLYFQVKGPKLILLDIKKSGVAVAVAVAVVEWKSCQSCLRFHYIFKTTRNVD